MKLQAGTTPEERDNFGRYLTSSQSASSVGNNIGFEGVDLFRHVHGDDVEGIYSYWSQRAKNRYIYILVTVL